MANNTNDENGNGVNQAPAQGADILPALVAPDGTIIVPHSSENLQSVDVADVDLLLTFADGTFVVISNGALDAMDDASHPVVFVTEGRESADFSLFAEEEMSSLSSLFRMVGTTSLARSGSLRVVSENVDVATTPEEDLEPPGYGYTPSEDAPVTDADLSPQPPAPVSGGMAASARLVLPREDLLDPVSEDPVSQLISSRPVVFQAGNQANPEPTIRLDANLTDDDIINIAESNGRVIISGSVGGAAEIGDEVSLIVNNTIYSGLVEDDMRFHLDVAGSDLVSDTDLKIDASITSANRTAAASEEYTLDLAPPFPVIEIESSITGDNIVNIREAEGDVAVTGSVGGDARAGDTVTLRVNGVESYGLVQADNRFSISVAGNDLLADADQRIDASITSFDEAGNSGTATAEKVYSSDANVPVPTISLNPDITADDTISIAEAEGDVAITGSVGGDARAGDTVTLTVNGVEFTGQVRADQTFSISVAGSDLVADADHSIEASVTSASDTGNQGNATTSESYTVDASIPVPTITLDPDITADDIISIAEAEGDVAITGSVGGDARAGDTVTLSVNETEYPGLVRADKTFSISVAGSDLVADADHSIDASVTSISDTGNTGTATTSEGYTVDTAVPVPTIALDPDITADDIISIAEATGDVAVTGSVGGDARAGDTVTLTVNDTEFSGLVRADKTFSISVAGSDLVADADHSIEASVTSASDTANQGTATTSEGYSVDASIPVPTITLDADITADDIISFAEAEHDVVITGSVGGDARAGDTVTLTVNGVEFTGQVRADQTFSISVAGSDLVADADQTIEASVTSISDTGNTGTASTSEGYTVDTSPPEPTISLDADITADDTISITEAEGDVAVTGSVGGDARAGDTVTLSVNETEYTGLVRTDKTFSISVAGSDLVADADHSIDASVTSISDTGNTGTATTSEGYTVDTAVPVPTIALDPDITADDIISIAEAAGDVAVTGSVGGDARAGDTVTLTVNDTEFSGLVRADKTFSISVAGSDLVADADHSIDASVTSISASGNQGSATTSEGYSIDSSIPVPTITLDPDITADDMISIDEASSDITITGQVGGDAQQGDQITLTVNGVDSIGLVRADKTFSISVAGSDLVADADHAIDASVTTTWNGNQGTATTSEGYTVDASIPLPTISLSPNITADDIINIAEASGDITITGQVGGDAQVGDQVTLRVNGVDSMGLVRADKTFSINVLGSDLVADADQVIDASIGTLNAAGNSGTATVTEGYTVDVLRPEATIQVQDDQLIAGETSQVIITFNEAVTGFTNADLTLIENATLTAVSSSDGGTTWTATLTPDAPVQDPTNVITLDSSGVFDAAGNQGAGSFDSNNYAIDTISPVVADVRVSHSLLADADAGITSFVVTVDFVEAMDPAVTPTLVFGADVSASLINGVSVWSNGNTTWTLTYEVADDNVDLANVSVDVTGARDVGGNPQQDYAQQSEFSIDTLNPGVVISHDNADGLVSDADNVVTYTLNFSEKVTSVTAADISFSGGTMTAAPVLAADGLSATFALTATDSSTADLVVDVHDTIVDLHGNPLIPSTLSLPVDTFILTANIVESNADAVVSDDDAQVDYRIDFSDRVLSVTSSDLSISGGTLTAGPVLAADGLSATFSVTATDDSTADLVVTANSTIVDVFNHGLVPATNTLAVDRVNPTVTITNSTDGVASDDDAVVNYTLSFSEEVQSLSVADLSISGGTLTTDPVLAADGRSATLSLTAPDSSTTPLTLAVNSTVTDVNGNTLVPLTDILPVDTTNPRIIDVRVSDTELTDTDIGIDKFGVVVTFSESMNPAIPPVILFSEDVSTSLSLRNGSWFNASGKANAMYVAMYDVIDANIELADIRIDVIDARDVNGNLQQDYAAQIEFNIDTLVTTMQLASDVADGVVSDLDDPVNYTLTFSDPVTAITVGDLSISGGTLTSAPILAGDGQSATFAVTAFDDSAADLAVTVGTLLDQNGDPVSSVTSILAVDTINPSVTIGEDNDDGLVSIEDSQVNYTLTFSEKVQAVADTDLSISGGTLTSGPVLAADGLSASFSVTATDNSTADLSVTVNNSIVDINGNPLTAASNTLAVNTVAPAAGFTAALYTAADLKLTGSAAAPIGSYVTGASDAEHALAASPAGQAARDRVDGTAANDSIGHNAAFHSDPSLWVKTLHLDFEFLTELSTIEIVADPAIATIAGFAFEGAGLVWDGSSTWTLTPDAAMSADLLLNGLNLNIVYQVGAGDGPVDFTVDINLAGTDGTTVFSATNNNLISNRLDFSWRDATTAADFSLTTASGHQVMVLPSNGIGVDIYAGDGDDIVNAGFGNDIIYGEAGADALDGGAGNDTASYAGSSMAVNASLATGSGSGGDAQGDSYLNIENLTGGEGDDTLTGDINANRLSGGDGNDTLIGGGGNDILAGGTNTAAGDTVSYAGTLTDVTASLATGTGEGDTYIGIENLTGGAGNDSLTGDTGNNTLSGGGGDDLFFGNGGNDSFEGGTNTATGDTVSYQDSSAGVKASLTTPQGTHATGIDHYNGIENLIGSAYADILTGDGSDNILMGGAGGDQLNGGAGTNDTASYANAGSGVVASLTSSFSAFQTNDAQGDSFSNIENLTGSEHSDTLFGNTSDNVLDGGAGDDVLDGLGGNDSLSGGQGDDHIYASTTIDNLPDLIAGGTGIDTLVLQDLVSGGSYDLNAIATVTDHIETLDIRDGVGSEIVFSGADIQAMVDNATASHLDILADTGDTMRLLTDPATEQLSPAFMSGTDAVYTVTDSGGATLAQVHWQTV